MKFVSSSSLAAFNSSTEKRKFSSNLIRPPPSSSSLFSAPAIHRCTDNLTFINKTLVERMKYLMMYCDVKLEVSHLIEASKAIMMGCENEDDADDDDVHAHVT